jgi:hypothetical protein
MPGAVASVAASKQLLKDADGPNESFVWLTPTGHQWVFGGGYDGTGAAAAAPAGTNTWLYATGAMLISRSEPLLPVDYERSIRRTTNQVVLIAEQQYLLGVDGPWAAALIDLAL